MPSRIITPEQFAATMEIQPWTFAVNYAKYCPHYYVHLRAWKPGSEEWEDGFYLPPITLKDCARFIEEQGEPMMWGRKKEVRMYATVNDWRYWQMDPHWSKCDLINRQELRLSTCKPVPATPPEQFSLL